MDFEVRDSEEDGDKRCKLASQQSTVESFVYFFNKTQRNINLYWINFHGKQEFYYCLRSGNGIKANTFVKHPWIFRDSITGQLMHVGNTDVFWPQNYRVRYKNDNRWLSCRKLIHIHFPLKSLKSACIWTYAASIFASKYNEIFHTINIPHNLLRDIRNVLYIMEQHHLIR